MSVWLRHSRITRDFYDEIMLSGDSKKISCVKFSFPIADFSSQSHNMVFLFYSTKHTLLAFLSIDFLQLFGDSIILICLLLKMKTLKAFVSYTANKCFKMRYSSICKPLNLDFSSFKIHGSRITNNKLIITEVTTIHLAWFIVGIKNYSLRTFLYSYLKRSDRNSRWW